MQLRSRAQQGEQSHPTAMQVAGLEVERQAFEGWGRQGATVSEGVPSGSQVGQSPQSFGIDNGARANIKMTEVGVIFQSSNEVDTSVPEMISLDWMHQTTPATLPPETEDGQHIQPPKNHA